MVMGYSYYSSPSYSYSYSYPYCIDKVAAEISFSAKDSLQKPATGDKQEIALVS